MSSDVTEPKYWNGGISGIVAMACAACSVALVVVPIFSLLFWSIFGTDVIGQFSSREPFVWFQVSLTSPVLIATFIYSLIVAGSVSMLCVLLISIYFYTELFEGTIFRLEPVPK